MNSTCVRVAAGMACQYLAVLLMNQMLFPLFDGVFTYARDISIMFTAVCLIGLSALAMWRPRCIYGRAFSLVAAVAAPCSFAGMAAGVVWGWPALLVVSACVGVFGRGWCSVLVNLAAVSLSGAKVAMSVATGLAAAYVLDAALVLFCGPWVCAALAIVVLPWAMLVLCLPPATDLFHTIASSEPAADVSVTRPASFLPLSSTLYVFQFIASVAFGFALRFGEVDGSPVFNIVLVAVAYAVFAVWVAVRRGKVSLDALCNVVVLTLLSGLAWAISGTFRGARASATVLSAGDGLFDAFITCVLVALAARNRATALSIFGWASGIGGLGTTLGALVGTTSNALLAADSTGGLSLIVVAFLVLFMGYVLFALRNYSFHAEIESVVEPAPVPAAVAVPSSGEEAFAARCHALAQERGLTPREEEVFAMLARGRNREYIENALQVSRNTVKAHVKHVYAKLDIHSHQELIDLVEGRAVPTGQDVPVLGSDR